MNKCISLISIIFIGVISSGCIPTAVLKNDASEHYKKFKKIDDKELVDNKVSEILFILNTGYIQHNNSNQLSIYLNYYSEKPQEVEIISADIVMNEQVVIKTQNYGARLKETSESDAIYEGSVYFHFHDNDLSNRIKKKSFKLKFNFLIDKTVHGLELPLEFENVLVWPT